MINVIIVDDEKLLRQGFIHMTDWPASGFRIVGEAASGDEALRLVEQLRPELVVTDIRMPGMDGIELTKAVKSRFPDTEVIVLSSYNDFEYVKETLQSGALDYILKPKMQASDLLTAMNKAKSKLKEQAAPAGSRNVEPGPGDKPFLPSLLAAAVVEEEWFAGELGRCGLADLTAPFRLVVAESGTSALPVEAADSADTQRLPGLPGLEAAPFAWIAAELDSGHAAILLHEREEGSAEAYFRRESNRFPPAAGGPVRLWISRTFERAADIPGVYRRLLSLLPYRFYFSGPGLIVETEIASGGEALEVSYRHLQSCVERGDLSPILAEWRERCGHIGADGRYIDPYALKKSLIETCYYIIHKMDELGLEAAELHQKKIAYFKSIEESPELASCLNELERVLGEIGEKLREAGPPSYGATIRAVTEYIRARYQEDITLQSVAAHFHLNKSYLSQLFKQQTGQNFNNYLTRLRVDKAKELLRRPDHNVFSVCEATGFWNPGYFGQVFKKAVGLTPSDYAKQFRKPASGKPLQP